MELEYVITKDPSLLPSQNYELLKENGLRYIEQLGHKLWTDYNIHDPGITILEALCYAIVDLGYRTDFSIQDLVSQANGQPNPDFFTAREILTNCPLTELDYRKLLIDIDAENNIEGVNNAWLLTENISPEIPLYAKCDEDLLTPDETVHPVLMRGLFDVLLEFDTSDAYGDLNADFQEFVVWEGPLFGARFRVNLPTWERIPRGWIEAKISTFAIGVDRIELVRQIDQEIWEIDLTITFKGLNDQNESFTFASRWFVVDPPDKNPPNEPAFRDALQVLIERIDSASFIAQFQGKMGEITAIVDRIWERLHANRNLCEDIRTVRKVDVEEVSICVDIEVVREADIEEILARVYLEIEAYLQPKIRFYSLKEMLDNDVPAESIFNGPVLEHGFIDDDELRTAQLRSHIYASDIISIIMDIDGVLGVKNLLMTKFDNDGVPVPGFSNVPWCLSVSTGHRPALSLERSRFLFFKDDLPFLPRQEEVRDTLTFLDNLSNSNKLTGHENDLSVPKGAYGDFANYTSIQNELPPTYAVGQFGLPNSASLPRQAQAKQLKAFLLFFDQLLANYLSQLARFKDLFSFHTDVEQTYFAQYVQDIKHVQELFTVDAEIEDVLRGPTGASASIQKAWQLLVEPEQTFLDRRNRFLDHLLGRFGEQFSDYALVLFNLQGQRKGANALIQDKMNFLKSYPELSAGRGKAFNYRKTKERGSGTLEPDVWNTENISGYQRRLALLLGIESVEQRTILLLETKIDPVVEMSTETDGDSGPTTETRYRFRFLDVTNERRIALTSLETYSSRRRALLAAEHARQLALDVNNYEKIQTKSSNKHYFRLLDEDGTPIAHQFYYFATAALRDAEIDALIEKFDDEAIFLVEHLLLRPKSKTDTLLPVCLPEDCAMCGEEDPYSFQLTLAMPAWPPRFKDANFRRYFERTARLEAPAHIALKFCWISEDQMSEFQSAYCEWLEAQQPLPHFQDDALISDKLDAFINILSQLRTVYPIATLHDCEESGNANPIRLGQTSLGELNP